MAVSPEGVLHVARRRTSEVVALPDGDGDGVAEPAVILSDLANAHSLAFKDGYLYIATTPAVMRVRWVNGAPSGKPEIRLHGALAEWFAARRLRAHVSVTDESDYAASFVVVETEELP